MKAIYERPLSRADLIALLGHFAGSPYRDRLEQIAAHDDAQREIISAQAREIARLAAPLPAQPAPAPAPPDGAEVREAAEALLDDYAGVEGMLLPDTLEKVLRLRAALRGGQKGGE